VKCSEGSALDVIPMWAESKVQAELAQLLAQGIAQGNKGNNI
jgi:hypothetical protein